MALDGVTGIVDDGDGAAAGALDRIGETLDGGAQVRKRGVHRPADVEMCVGQHLRRRVGVVAGVGEFGDAFIGAVADDEGEALRRLGRAGEDGPCGSGQKGTEGEAAPAGAKHGADREGGGGHGSTS